MVVKLATVLSCCLALFMTAHSLIYAYGADDMKNALTYTQYVGEEYNEVEAPEVGRCNVAVIADGKTYDTFSYHDIAEEIVNRLGIELGEYDYIKTDADPIIRDDAVIEVVRRTASTESQFTDLSYRTLRQTVKTLWQGEKSVSGGQTGTSLDTYRVYYENGVEVERELIKTVILIKPVDRVLPSGSFGKVTVDGESLDYSAVYEFSATAYSCEGRTNARTASGLPAQVGNVAVDPSIIPYGTKLYICASDGTSWEYGFATAADCGAFRGALVDLYFDTFAECYAFGRRACKVYVLN